MDFNLLYNRIRLIFSNPSLLWEEVSNEGRTVSEVRVSFLLPMTLLVTLSSFFGSLFFSHTGLSFLYPVLMAIKDLATIIVTVEFATFTITEISTAFTDTRNHPSNYKLVTYSMAPYIVSMLITRLFPSLVFLNLAGLWGIYVLWVGTLVLKPVAGEFRIRYMILVALASVVFYLATGWIMLALLDGLYFTIFR